MQDLPARYPNCRHKGEVIHRECSHRKVTDETAGTCQKCCWVEALSQVHKLKDVVGGRRWGAGRRWRGRWWRRAGRWRAAGTPSSRRSLIGGRTDAPVQATLLPQESASPTLDEANAAQKPASNRVCRSTKLFSLQNHMAEAGHAIGRDECSTDSTIPGRRWGWWRRRWWRAAVHADGAGMSAEC